ncbi:MAG: cobalt transporter [Clostridia bacterium]|nr:cobalt transporter [Clostridia bacterium]
MDHEHSHEYMHEHGIAHDHHAHGENHPHTGEPARESGEGHEHEHTHVHSHEHTHADGTTHAHAHEHTHAHPHEHPQGCPGAAHCNSDCDGCGVDPRTEIIALMQYMVNHNAAHANELAQLAGRLRDVGDVIASEQVLQAVSDFEKGNMRLSTVLRALDIAREEI